MMKKVLFSAILAGFMVSAANAATIYMTNSGGTAGLTIPEGSTGVMQIRLDVAGNDTIPVAFVNAFLNSDDDNLCVTAVEGGQAPGWDKYDRSSFSFDECVHLSQDQGNEYGLISGDQNGGNALGAGSYIIDNITILNTAGQSGDKNVTFELGARQPAAFGAAPTFLPYIPAPANFPPGFGNFLYMGNSSSQNPAFVITKAVPEPATLALLALGGLAALRRRS